jgi:hypothetical protein
MAVDPEDDERSYTHLLTLLSVSTGMVGVCLTAVGLVGVFKALKEWEGVVDELLVLGCLLFSVVTLLSFLAIRTRIRQVWPHYLLMLDILFCLGIVTMLAASVLLTFAVV